jgi:pyruvate/2-oxoglutarate dehydrogenase complex dihydrolipoamide dehydrogenase (E3) component
MTRMRKIRAQISENDSAERFSKSLGVDLFLGNATFSGPNTVEVNGTTLNFLKCCIATGGKPKVPKIDGVDKAPIHTSDTIFNLTTQPKNMLVFGGGPIGAELG